MQHIEVESKFFIEDADSLREKLKKNYKFIKKINKVDTYFSQELKGYPKKSLRIRREDDKYIANFKKWRDYKDGIHAKEEIEFRLSEFEEFLDFLDDFGFKKWIVKEKETELYKSNDGSSLELSYVKKLGWFLEIEILCSKKDIKHARKRILEIMGTLGLDKKQAIRKGYTKDLWNLKKKS